MTEFEVLTAVGVMAALVWVVMFCVLDKQKRPALGREQGVGKSWLIYFLPHCSPFSHRMKRVARPVTTAGRMAAKWLTFECIEAVHSFANKDVWLTVNTVETIPSKWRLSIIVVSGTNEGALAWRCRFFQLEVQAGRNVKLFGDNPPRLNTKAVFTV